MSDLGEGVSKGKDDVGNEDVQVSFPLPTTGVNLKEKSKEDEDRRKTDFKDGSKSMALKGTSPPLQSVNLNKNTLECQSYGHLSTALPVAEESHTQSTSTASKAKSKKPWASKSAEMQLYLDKLRQMVPYAKNIPKTSKVELIHCAIDYITDLQESLEARVKRKLSEQGTVPGNRAPLADLSGAEHNSSNISTEGKSENPMPAISTPDEMLGALSNSSSEIGRRLSTDGIRHSTVEQEGNNPLSAETTLSVDKSPHSARPEIRSSQEVGAIGGESGSSSSVPSSASSSSSSSSASSSSSSSSISSSQQWKYMFSKRPSQVDSASTKTKHKKKKYEDT